MQNTSEPSSKYSHAKSERTKGGSSCRTCKNQSITYNPKSFTFTRKENGNYNNELIASYVSITENNNGEIKTGKIISSEENGNVKSQFKLNNEEVDKNTFRSVNWNF